MFFDVLKNYILTLIRESWKNPKRWTVTAALYQFVYVSVLWIFFRKSRSVTVPKMAYIFVQHGIFPLILAYVI